MPENDSPRREARAYPNIIRFVRETPWAILESKLHDITDMLRFHAAGHRLTPEEIQARIGNGPPRRDVYSVDGVAVIPVYGVITPRADVMTEMSGGTSIDRLQQAVRAAVADDKIHSILLDVNSPGGSVAMLTEMASEIRQARRKKPVVAIANTMAASAAYHLASQANEVVVTPSGSVGSIGAIATHDDISASLEQAGVKTTVVTSSKFKGELSPFAPLSDDAKAQLQQTVDKYGQMFELDVARGRGVPVDTVREQYGQGRMLLARDAQAAGMVDAVASFDDTLARMQRVAGSQQTRDYAAWNVGPVATTSTASLSYTVSASPPPDEPNDIPDTEAAYSGLSFADQADQARDAVQNLVDRTGSLAELRNKGLLTKTKRERLAACSEALHELLGTLDGFLAQTAPVTHADQAAGEFAAYLARTTRKGY